MQGMRSLYYIYVLSLFLLLSWGAHAWYTWPMDGNFNILLLVLLLFVTTSSWLYRIKNNIKLNFHPALLLAWLALMEMRCLHSGGGLHPQDLFVGGLMAYPLWVVSSDEEHIEEVLSSVIKLLAVLLVLGIALHLVLLVIGIVPSKIIRYPSSVLYAFYNYGVLLKSATEYEASGIRFQSVFLEPGYCGTLLAFLLHAVRYDFKKRENVVLLISLFLSLSLAGIITFVTGYVLNGWAERKNMTAYFAFGIILGAIVLFGINYNQGDNVVNEMVLSRIMPDEEDSQRNQRNSIGADIYFESLFETGEWLHGLGNERIAMINGEDLGTAEVSYGEDVIRGAGYKIFILKFGVLAVLVAFLFYLFVGPMWLGWTNRYAWSFLLLIIITFIPTSYPMSHSWTLPYVFGMVYASHIENKDKLNTDKLS